MEKKKLVFLALIITGFLTNQLFSQVSIQIYTVPQNGSQTVLIENGKLYRVTVRSCWYSAYARMGTYLIYGLNIADSKTNGQPEILTVSESGSVDWTFGFSLNGNYDADMSISSDGWGDQGLSIVVERMFLSEPASVSELDLNTISYKLSQNYPNPFNPTSTIQYDLPEAANVTLIVYDILGREVIRLVDQQMQPGYHRAVWDARDHAGRAMPTGIYIARLLVPPTAGVTPAYTKSIKMLLLK